MWQNLCICTKVVYFHHFFFHYSLTSLIFILIILGPHQTSALIAIELIVKKITILYQGQKIWNALPRSITNLSNILSFSESFENLLINYLVYKNSHALLKKPKASRGLLAKSLSLSFHLNVYIYFAYLSWQTTNELSLFHSNIRSLGASLDNLINLLPKLTLHFTTVDLSETKLSTNQNTLLNLNIPGSKFLS